MQKIAIVNTVGQGDVAGCRHTGDCAFSHVFHLVPVVLAGVKNLGVDDIATLVALNVVDTGITGTAQQITFVQTASVGGV